MAELYGTYDGWKLASPPETDDDDEEAEAECPWCNRRESACCCP
jgi:hypothetical protein